jgi:RecB family exonuclease
MSAALTLLASDCPRPEAHRRVMEANKLEVKRDRMLRTRRGIMDRIVRRHTGHDDLTLIDRDIRAVEDQINKLLEYTQAEASW